MKPEVKIRTAVSADFELIAAVGKESFRDAFIDNPQMPPKDLLNYLEKAFALAQISSELADPKAIFLLAEIDGEIAGYAKLERGAADENVRAKNPIKLKRLYARQKFIGCGVGANLLKRCLEESARSNHDVIWLTVWEHNPQAQNFYRKWNFEKCGKFDFFLGEALLTDFVMQHTVSNLS